jgi:fluoroquinolone transport system permease protein
MNALVYLLLTELKFQLRHGFFIAAGIVTLVWVLLLSFLPNSLRPFWFGIVAILDLTSIGLMFGFGLGVLDKSQQTIVAIRLTPVKSWTLAAARIITLSLLMILTLTILSAMVLPTTRVWLLALGIVLSSVFFSAVGVTTARRFSTVNQFMIFFAVSGFVWAIPALYYADVFQSNLWLLFPSTGAVVFFKAALVNDWGTPPFWLAATLQISWIAVVFLLGERWAYRNLENRFGGH